MQDSFWHNTIWYLALFVISLGMIVIGLIKSNNRKFGFAFFSAVLGFSYFIELQLLLILSAYTYYPKIVPDAFQDAILGNHFSQISVTAATVMIAVLGLKKRWYFVFAAVFYLIDVLFAALGIYRLYWYQHIFTFVGFAAYSWFVSLWYNKIRRAPKKWIYYLTLFFGVFGAGAITIDLPLKLLNIQVFRANIFDDMTKNHYAVSFISAVLIIILLIIIYESKLHWAKRGVAFLLLFLSLYFLRLIGVLSTAPGLFAPAALFYIFAHYVWIVVFNRCLKTQVSSFGSPPCPPILPVVRG